MQETIMGSETLIPIPNGDFEAEDCHWEFFDGRGDCRVTHKHAMTGRSSLQVIGSRDSNGAKVQTEIFTCKGPGVIDLSAMFLCKSGRNVLITLHEFDVTGAILPDSSGKLTLESPSDTWRLFNLRTILRPETTHARIMILGLPEEGEQIEMYFDRFEIKLIRFRIPAWPPTYKLSPGSRKLTAADVVGPDGVVYPNWRNAGVEGGIPDVPVVLKLADLGARPETNIADLLEQACNQVGASGGGAILVGEGVHFLDRPVVIKDSRVVIRGAGRDRTHLVFRYSVIDRQAEWPKAGPRPGVFEFLGDALGRKKQMLAEDGKRGDLSLVLSDVGNLGAGDTFVIQACDTERWKALTGDKSPANGRRRSNSYEVKAVDGKTITIGQPLRIDFPVVDESHVIMINPVAYSGIEDMTIEHACRMPFQTVSSCWAWNCWVQRVDVLMCGQSGVHFDAAKCCEVRDCSFTGFDESVHVPHRNWWGYGGFTGAWDCLMERTIWRCFRHAPQVQFGAQGCVIRDSTFEGSDAQWHAGWATENLFENCIIGPTGPYGSYGYGCYCTPSHDTSHGPNGPRNVVYNCDIRSNKEGVMLLGANENFIFLHNRFTVGEGAGFVGQYGCFDTLISNNTFVLADDVSPLLRLDTEDCVGVELFNNRVHGGNGNIYKGQPALAVDKDNQALPSVGRDAAPRPKADPVSIYEWQKTSGCP